MAKTKQNKLDATRPFYAAVGVADLTVEFARSAATDVQARLSKVDLEPKEAQAKLEARVVDIGEDAKALPRKVESYLNETVSEVTEAYGDLAVRGKNLVNRIRRQQATQDAKAAGRTTATKAKTAKTQTTKSAQQTAQSSTETAKKSANTTKSAAKKTGATAKRNAKATNTSAKKTASASAKAAGDAAQKVGN